MKVQRIRRMHTMLQDGGDVELERFVATCEYQMGLTRPTILQYLRTLERLDFVEIDEAAGIVREVVKE